MEEKDYRVKIMQSNLCVQKTTVSDNIHSAFETIVTKTPTLYRYIPKTLLVSTAVQSWSHADVFTREPIRRFAIVMVRNEAFLGAKPVIPLHFQKVNMNSITVCRNGYLVATTPIQTKTDKKTLH